MPDIIEQAFSHSHKLSNWEQLGHWLKAHAGGIKGVNTLIAASAQALADGVDFPASPEEARQIIKKYRVFMAR